RPPVVVVFVDRVGGRVDLFPGAQPAITDEEVVGARLAAESDGVAESVADDDVLGVARDMNRGTVGRCGTGERGEWDDCAVEILGCGCTGPWSLRSESAAFIWRVATATQLAPVGPVEGGSVTGAGIKSSISAEFEVSHRMAGEVLAPVPDKDLFAADHHSG